METEDRKSPPLHPQLGDRSRGLSLQDEIREFLGENDEKLRLVRLEMIRHTESSHSADRTPAVPLVHDSEVGVTKPIIVTDAR